MYDAVAIHIWINDDYMEYLAIGNDKVGDINPPDIDYDGYIILDDII